MLPFFLVVAHKKEILYNTHMDDTKSFWQWFSEIEPLMPLRAVSWRKTFEYLDQKPSPIIMVETGCARQIGNWIGDGQSTLLLDRYAQARGTDSRVFSVDLDQTQVKQCQAQVSNQTSVDCSDSVKWLHDLNRKLLGPIDFLYLDSFDVDWLDAQPSALHHLKELAAIRPSIGPGTLVMVDDSPIMTHAWIREDANLELVGNNCIGGKGRIVAEYAENVGAKQEWCHYQVAWTGLA